MYPDRSSARSKYDTKAGVFEYLMPFIAFYFDKAQASTKAFSKHYNDGGLFLYNEDEYNFIRRTSFSGKVGELKFMQMCAYLFEIGYDLAIGPNVSRNPGFEGCGVIFEKTSRMEE